MKVARRTRSDLLRADDWYDSVTDLAMAHFDCDSAGVAVRAAHGAVLTLAASDEVVEKADRLQAQHADGPAVCPAWSAAQVAVNHVALNGPWPVWTAAIAELGVLGVLTTQIVTPEGSTGAFTLYYDHPVIFADHELALARVLAQHVSLEVHQALNAAHLVTTVEARTRIGQAQGMLMHRFALTAHEALAVLTRHSEATDTRLQDIAECLVATRDLDAYAEGRQR